MDFVEFGSKEYLSNCKAVMIVPFDCFVILVVIGGVLGWFDLGFGIRVLVRDLKLIMPHFFMISYIRVGRRGLREDVRCLLLLMQ